MPPRRLVIIGPIFICIAFFSWSLLRVSSWHTPRSPIPDVEAGDETESPYWAWDVPSRFSHEASGTSKTADICAGFPTYLLSTIQVALKVGASEPSERINAQISGVTKCISNLLVFSDMEQQLGPYHAYDIIATLPSSYRGNNTDFDAYDVQKELFVAGQLKPGGEGWRLDRFKFLPMVERAYEMNREAKWFVFLEADTYIVWDNVFRLLDNFDPSTPLYMGSPSPGRHQGDGKRTWFAYGGTGFILSTAAVQSLLARKVGPYGEYTQPPLNAQYGEILKRDPCGDSVLGWALFEKGVELSGLWPMFNPHPLHGVPFSEKYWCQPVIAMHRSLPNDMVKLWEWEQRRNRTRPLLYADLIEYTGLGTFDKRTDWDNADWGGFRDADTSPAHSSFEACGTACRDHPDCFQYTFKSPGICTFSRSIRLGVQKMPEGEGETEGRFTAGWDVKKIQDWIQENPCTEPIWVKPSVERIF